MRNTKRVISMILAVCMLLSVLPLGVLAVSITNKPADGTTEGQPFLAGTGGSTNFRIPGIVTLADGTLIAAADARWNGTADAGGLDTLVSVSKDNGANWTYTFANYLGDNGDTWINTSSCIIDPAIGTDGTTAYLIADLFPAGFAINSAKYYAQTGSTGFNADGNLLLRSDEENGLTFGSSTYASGAASATYGYYLADGKIWTTEGTKVEGYSVDAYFNITGNDVNTNLFFSDSPYKPFPTDYLYMTTSTDGLEWSAPTLLKLKEASEQTLLVGPGNGTYDASTGRMVFTAYDYTNGYQRACVIWRDTDGAWHRTEDASVNDWSSEASVVALDDGTLRCFYRDGYSVVRYTDFVWSAADGNYVRDPDATQVSTDAPRRSNNQLSAIRYSQPINGKDAILVACASSADARSNGYLYVFLLEDDNSMELAYAYDIIPGKVEGYAYNCISEMNNGDIALLYEGDNAATSASAEIIFTTIDMDDVTVFENDARLNFIDVEMYVGDTVTYKDTTGNYSYVSDYDTAVAAVTADGVTATVPAATGMQSGTAYALEDALYTLTAVGSSWYLHHTLSDGTEVYIDAHAGAGNGGYPNRAYTTELTITAGTEAGTMWIKDSGGSLHLHKEAAAPYWNQCANPCGYKHDLMFFRAAEAGETESDIFAGYVQVTDVADLEDGGKYLIAAYDDAQNLYILNPVQGGLSATSNDQLAKVTGDAEISSTTVTIRALAVGTTQVQVGTNVYTVNVSELPAVELEVEVNASTSFTVAGAYDEDDVTGLDTAIASVALETTGDSVTYAELRDTANNGTQIALADSAYTFTAVGDGTYYATIDADGSTWYVRPNSKGHSTNQTALTITWNADGSVYLKDSSHYLYVNRSSLAWDRTSSTSGYETHITFYLYGAGEDASSPIPGYKRITSADDITATCLIAFYGADNQLYVMNPTTRTASAYNQMAAVVTGLENASTTVTVTGVAEGNTSMALAGTKYNITVLPENYDPISIPATENVYQGPAVTITQKPADGTTQDQPFASGTGGSVNFRIPGIITLADGTLIASTDARWNHAGDGAGLDTLVSVSTDNGANWTYTFANYLGDNGDVYNILSTCIIDPAIGTDGTTAYMIADLFPAGIALNTSKYGPVAGENGFDANGNLMLRDLAGDTTVIGQDGYNTMAANREYNYYLDLETYKIYTNNGTLCAGFEVDEYFNISYTDAAGTTHATNLFFADSPFQPYPTDYLYLTKSTDGLEWSVPELLNLQAKAEQTLLVGPGNGTYDAHRGNMVFTAYRHTGGASGTAYECSCLIWMDGEGNWHRSEDATVAGWSSEASAVVLADGTVRVFYRDGYSNLRYTDYLWSDAENNYVRDTSATEVDTAAPKKSGCQLTAVRYSGLIEGKEAVIVATPAYSGGRNDGHVYVFLVEDDNSMTLAYDYDVTPNTNEYYAYSCITELGSGNLGLLWESNGSRLTYTEIAMDAVTVRDNDARLTFQNVTVLTGQTVTVTDGTGDYTNADTAELDKTIATVELDATSVVTVSGQLGSDANYTGALIDLNTCRYDFAQDDSGRWIISNGDIYLNTNGNTGYPHGTASCTFTIEAGYEEGTFYIRSTADSNDNGNTNYLYFDRAARNWNRVNNLQSNTTWMTNCSMSLFKAAEGVGSGEIPGYDRVTSLDDVVEGQYLIGACAADGNWYVAYPSTVETTRFNQIAKVGDSTTITTTHITFEGVAKGYTEVLIGSTVYRVTVKETVTKDITLNSGETYVDIIEGDNYADAEIAGLDTSIVNVTMEGNDGSNDQGVALVPSTSLADGTYVILNTRAQKLVNNGYSIVQNAPGLALNGGTSSFNADTAVWTIKAVDGGYTVQDTTGKYLTVGSNTTSLVDDVQVLSVVYANGTWTLSQNGSYLNDFGGAGSTASGWYSTSAPTDSGSQFAIYAYGEANAEPSTTVTFTGVGAGSVTLTIERVTYNVTVGHTCSYEAVVTAPTCTEEGYTTYTCSCGDSYVADKVPALGHSFENGVCTVCGAGIAVNEATGETYTTLAEALAAAEAGETVQLLADTAEAKVLVTPGIILDLNGKTLTAEYVVGFNGAGIVDHAGGGKLTAAEKNVILDEDNGMIPVYDGTGYIFTKAGFAIAKDTAYEGSGIKVIAMASPVNMDVVELLKDGAADNNLQVAIVLSWENDQGTGSQKFVFTDEVVGSVYSSQNGAWNEYDKMFSMVITGIDGIRNLKANIILISGTNAEYGNPNPVAVN